MMSKKHIEIVIATKNRREDLLYTLKRTSPLLNEYFSCVVFDDGSTDGTFQAVSELFPEIKLLRNETSKGYIYCRNQMLNNTKADFAVSLDDDASFLTENPLQKIDTYFSQNPKCGVMAFRIFWGKTNVDSTEINESPIRVQSFVGCGHAWRIEAWNEISNYPIWFKFYGEENFASYELFKKNWEVHYVPQLFVQHRVNLLERAQSKRNFSSRLRRSLRTGWYNFFLFFPFTKAFNDLSYSIWMTFRTKIFKGNFNVLVPLFLAIFDLIIHIPKLIKHRNALTYEEYDNYNKLNPSKIYWKPEK